MLLTSVLEAPDQRASPHDDKEDDAPSNGAEFILNDGVDGGLSGVDMETPADANFWSGFRPVRSWYPHKKHT